jgi:hypothetical protein
MGTRITLVAQPNFPVPLGRPAETVTARLAVRFTAAFLTDFFGIVFMFVLKIRLTKVTGYRSRYNIS